MGRKLKVLQKNICVKMLVGVIAFVLMQGVFRSCTLAGQEAAESGQASIGRVMSENLAEGVVRILYQQFMPVLSFQEGSAAGIGGIVQNQVEGVFPLYSFALEQGSAEEMLVDARQEAMDMSEDIAEEEASEVLNAPEDGNTAEKDASEQNQRILSLAELMEAENGATSAPEAVQEEGQQGALTEGPGELAGEPDVFPENPWEGIAEASPELLTPISSFVPHTKLAQVDLAPLADYETLLREFYTVDTNTSASSERLDVGNFLTKNMTISKEGEGPQILIFHTHSQEGFADSVAGDESTTIMGVGDYLTRLLQEVYGYEVLHHRGKYDVNVRDDAYSKALPELEQLLKENPSIQVVIDLHRDEMPAGTKLVMDLDGRPTARFMFFNGLSRTKKTGNISYLKNENLDNNLAFSFQMQQKAMEYYPGLTRKIYLKGYRYNMHLVPQYLLVELGAQNNTVEEAMNACDLLAHILDLVLSGEG